MENPTPEGASLASVQGSTGVHLRPWHMWREANKMNRFSIVGTLNSGGPKCEPVEVERSPKANRAQRTEDAIWTFRESDPPIVVRDGNAGHMAKGWAGRQRRQSTHLGKGILSIQVSSSLLALGIGITHFVEASESCASS